MTRPNIPNAFAQLFDPPLPDNILELAKWIERGLATEKPSGLHVLCLHYAWERYKHLDRTRAQSEQSVSVIERCFAEDILSKRIVTLARSMRIDPIPLFKLDKDAWNALGATADIACKPAAKDPHRGGCLDPNPYYSPSEQAERAGVKGGTPTRRLQITAGIRNEIKTKFPGWLQVKPVGRGEWVRIHHWDLVAKHYRVHGNVDGFRPPNWQARNAKC